MVLISFYSRTPNFQLIVLIYLISRSILSLIFVFVFDNYWASFIHAPALSSKNLNGFTFK